MRRLPVFLVIDVSESMAGDNLRSLQDGIARLIKTLRAKLRAIAPASEQIHTHRGTGYSLAT